MPSKLDTELDFDQVYLQRLQPCILDRIDDFVFRDKAIIDLHCNGFLAPGDLQRYGTLLRSAGLGTRSKPRLLLELGCGFGGFGRWLAEYFDCALVGIDRSCIAIAAASMALPVTDRERVHFWVADFTATGLNSGVADVVVSLDALYLAKNPVMALREVRRILAPEGFLLFTVFVQASETKLLDYPYWRQSDWQGWLGESELELAECWDDTDAWRTWMRRKHQARWKARDQIRKELGDAANSYLCVSSNILGLNDSEPFINLVQRHIYIVQQTNRKPMFL